MHLPTSSQTSPRRLRLGPRRAAESGSHSPPLPLPVLLRVPPVSCPGRGRPRRTVVHSAVLTLQTFPEGRRFTGLAATPAVPGSASADSTGVCLGSGHFACCLLSVCVTGTRGAQVLHRGWPAAGKPWPSIPCSPGRGHPEGSTCVAPRCPPASAPSPEVLTLSPKSSFFGLCSQSLAGRPRGLCVQHPSPLGSLRSQPGTQGPGLWPKGQSCSPHAPRIRASGLWLWRQL